MLLRVSGIPLTYLVYSLFVAGRAVSKQYFHIFSTLEFRRAGPLWFATGYIRLRRRCRHCFSTRYRKLTVLYNIAGQHFRNLRGCLNEVVPACSSLEEACFNRACCLRLTLDYLCFGESGGAGRCEDFFRPRIHMGALYLLIIADCIAQLSLDLSRVTRSESTTSFSSIGFRRVFDAFTNFC